MRLAKIIAWVALGSWAIQSFAFVMFFASSFTHLIVRCFVTLGIPVPESSVQAFLSGSMKVLTWPIRPLFASAWSEANVAKIILLLALNSLIWGGVLGTLIFFLKNQTLRKSSR
jgi:hypothetical protein